MIRHLRNSLVSGVLLIVPIAITLYVINFLIQKIGSPTRDLFFFFIPESSGNQVWVEYGLYIVSVFLVIIFITCLGWLSQRVIGRIVVNAFERIVDNLPVVRNLYNTVKQIRDTFVKQEKAVFQKAVMIEYPRKGVWVVGFLTSKGKGEIQYKSNSNLLNVFVPTTPNPTSGFLLMLPEEEVKELEMPISDAMKLIISGGAVVPEWETAQSLEEQSSTED